MKVSVVICTWNRASLLRGALASLVDAGVPEGTDREVVVVDNASTDSTAVVVEEFRGELGVRRVEEPAPGLSHARNRAVSEVEGEYILWLDDDVLVDPGWLEAYVEAFERWPAAAFFGGPIRPRYEGTPPAWLEQAADRVAHAYAGRDLAPDQAPLGPSVDRLPYGANFAVRAIEQRRHPYPVELGRLRDTPRPGGEEIAVMSGILAAGGTGRWVPDAGVDHRIEADRQTTAYLRSYAEADALHEVAAGWAPPESGWLTVPRLLARLLRAELRYRVSRPFAPPGVWAGHLLRAGDARGRLRAHRSGASPGRSA